MTNKLGTKQATILPPATRYEDDLYTWVQEQVALLRAGRLSEIDAANVAEELGDVGKTEFYKLKSAMMVLLQHLLKWEHQPARRSRSWMSTVDIQRSHVRDVLEDNPGLKSRIGEAVDKAYRDGRKLAAGETDLDYETFPETCPYDFEAMMTRPIVYEPPPVRGKRSRSRSAR
jgi:Domain of unknown function DUF29